MHSSFQVGGLKGNIVFPRPIMVYDLIAGYPIKPAAERKSAMSIGPYALPCLQKNLVSDILGLLTTANLDEHKPIDHRLIMVIKLAKSRGITLLDGVLY
jgi:hypothetical protein